MGKDESTPGFSRAHTLSTREGEPVRAETAKSSLDHVVQRLEHHAQEFGLNLLKNGSLGAFLARRGGKVIYFRKINVVKLIQPDCGGGSRKGEWLLQQLMWEEVRTEVEQRPQASREEARCQGEHGGRTGLGTFSSV